MFGGPHHSDEVTRIEQSGWSKKKERRPRHGARCTRCSCAPVEVSREESKNPRIDVDTADFVRHVPEFPRVSPSFRLSPSFPSFQSPGHSSREIARRAPSFSDTRRDIPLFP